MNKLIYFLPLILIVACTPQECPKLSCPSCTCPTTEPTTEYLHVYFIDVGQGDATLIKQGDTEMLIDCGKDSKGPSVVEFLEMKDVDRLEYLLITHPDADHLGGCDDVLNEIKTNTVITNGESKDTISYREVRDAIDTEQQIIADIGDKWVVDSTEIEVIQADKGQSDDNANTIVTKLIYGDTSILFTGDCDKECEQKLITKDIEADILKVPHHGTKFGSTINFLERVNPQVAIIPIGPNSYGHPADETLDRLTQEGITIYRTDKDGNIEIRTDGKGYEVIR